MAQSPIAPGKTSDGRSKVLLVPKNGIANPKAPKASELKASNVIDATYLLFGDGFDHQTDVTKSEISRYTLPQALEEEGKVKDTFTLKYPYVGTEDDTLRTRLTQGSEWWLVERLVVENEQDIAAQQLLSIVAPVKAGLQRDIPRAENTQIGKMQELLVTGTVHRDVTVVA
ncbi:hypothetical protein [Canibacter oris]|uniref:Uncharacterized protein n=1 Tax=Canibacter oris TaxID=1365628 RepID=A0A840DSE4_9MICO|nr:hypothetical protein [Canibacter oris]MBB4072046.1 hypothetical protein [Canibacter oris]